MASRHRGTKVHYAPAIGEVNIEDWGMRPYPFTPGGYYARGAHVMSLAGSPLAQELGIESIIGNRWARRIDPESGATRELVNMGRHRYALNNLVREKRKMRVTAYMFGEHVGGEGLARTIDTLIPKSAAIPFDPTSTVVRVSKDIRDNKEAELLQGAEARLPFFKEMGAFLMGLKEPAE